jgi:hypothetical protein
MYTDFWMMHRSYGEKDPATRELGEGERKADRSRRFVWDSGDLELVKAADVEKDKLDSGDRRDAVPRTPPPSGSDESGNPNEPGDCVARQLETKTTDRAGYFNEEEKKPVKYSEKFDVTSIPEDVLKNYWSMYWRTGERGAESGGRPSIPSPCPKCGDPFGAREMRQHMVKAHGRTHRNEQRKKCPPLEVLKKLYLDEKQTYDQIGATYGVSRTSVYLWVRKYKLEKSSP